MTTIMYFFWDGFSEVVEAPAVAGPYFTVAPQFHVAGSLRAQMAAAGSVAGQCSTAGSRVGDEV